MPRIKSAKKALRQSVKKREQNLFWKKKIKDATKALDVLLKTNGSNIDILKKEESALYKAVDKAAKNKVIHKNKASRLKSRYAQRISAKFNKSDTAPKSGKSGKSSAVS